MAKIENQLFDAVLGNQHVMLERQAEQVEKILTKQTADYQRHLDAQKKSVEYHEKELTRLKAEQEDARTSLVRQKKDELAKAVNEQDRKEAAKRYNEAIRNLEKELEAQEDLIKAAKAEQKRIEDNWIEAKEKSQKRAEEIANQHTINRSNNNHNKE